MWIGHNVKWMHNILTYYAESQELNTKLTQDI